MGKHRVFALFVAFVLAISGLSLVGSVTAGATATTVTVDQTSLAPSGFWASPTGSDTGTAGFVTGPATPPAGSGSLAIDVPAGQHRSVYDYQFGKCSNWPVGFPNCTAPVGTPIAAITALSYSTYRDGGASTPNALPSLNIEIDPNPAGGGPHYSTLVWERSNNGGSTTDDTWETWDAYNGGNGVFWSSQVIPGFQIAGAGGTLLTWNAIKAANPNAAIVYGIGPNVGTGPTFKGNVDALKVGLLGNDTTFDFETSTTNTVVGQGDVSLLPAPTTPWVSNDDNTTAAGDVTFVNGPATPPKGVGSAQLTTTPVGGISTLVYTDLANASTRFSQISDLHYATYRSSADTGNLLAISLQLNVDYDKTDASTGWQGRVVFEPYFTAGSGNIPQNTWQAWNPMGGKWWMTGNPVVNDLTGTKACPQSSPCTWAALLTAYPKSGFNASQPFVVLKAGQPWPGFVGNADDLRIGVDGSQANFDLEPQCTTDCYVATTGSDSGSTGTVGDPFLTVQKAVNTVNAGGTVHVANGTYNTLAATTIPKAVTIQGQSRAGTILNGPRAQVDPAGSLAGLQITGTTSNVTIEQLTIQHYDYGIFTNGNTMSNITIQNLNASDNRLHGIWIQANVGVGINGLTVDNVDASRNNQLGGGGGRGLWVINGPKSNVSVTNSTFDQNGLVGVDLSDGSITGATVTGNTVTNNGDSGIGVLGAIAGGANLVANNVVTNNGRYGIEIKNSTGDSTDTGTGSVTVSANTVSRTAAATDARDYGGIVVIRRDRVLPINPDQPAGIVIENNSVSGFHRKPVGSTGDGFGIVVGGASHVITQNTVTNNDIGVQVQAGNPVLNQQSTDWFDRDDATNGSALVNRNSITGNGLGFRTAGTVTVDATCNWWGAVSGPGAPGGPGSGDGVSVGAAVTPWLLSSNLNGACAGPPTVSIGSASSLEGSGIDPVVNLPVTLSQPYGGTVTVQYATADGTGAHPAIAPNDYTPTSGTVTFLAGETTKNVPVTIRGNYSATQLDEYDETFTVSLSLPTNATLGTADGTVTILNDDTPTVSLPTAIINTVEGNSGTHTVPVTVHLSNPSVVPISVNYTTAPGTAVAPSDYLTTSGTVTFAPFQTSTSFNVTIKGDTALEDYQFFTVSISGPSSAATAPTFLGNASEMVQILNDEKPVLASTSPSGAEGSTRVLKATLKQRYYLPITVNYATSDLTAIAPGDYTPTSGSLVFPAGVSGTQTVVVPTNYDFLTELAETFQVTYTSGSIKTSPVLAKATIKANHT